MVGWSEDRLEGGENVDDCEACHTFKLPLQPLLLSTDICHKFPNVFVTSFGLVCLFYCSLTNCSLTNQPFLACSESCFTSTQLVKPVVATHLPRSLWLLTIKHQDLALLSFARPSQKRKDINIVRRSHQMICLTKLRFRHWFGMSGTVSNIAGISSHFLKSLKLEIFAPIISYSECSEHMQ